MKWIISTWLVAWVLFTPYRDLLWPVAALMVWLSFLPYWVGWPKRNEPDTYWVGYEDDNWGDMDWDVRGPN